MRCHTSDHYLATSVPHGGRSSVFPCQVIIVLVLRGVCPIQIPPSLSLIVFSAQHMVVTCLKDFSPQRYWVTNTQHIPWLLGVFPPLNTTNLTFSCSLSDHSAGQSL